MADLLIDPSAVRAEVKKSNVSNRSGAAEAFDTVLTAVSPISVAVAATQGGYKSAAVTSAALTGLAGAGQAMGNAPYYSGASGLNYSGVPFGAGYGTAAGVPGVPSQDYQEKQALFQQMNDANWEMLVAQVTVNEISRDYQARSNILKTKSDTELNAVRNMRA